MDDLNKPQDPNVTTPVTGDAVPTTGTATPPADQPVPPASTTVPEQMPVSGEQPVGEVNPAEVAPVPGQTEPGMAATVQGEEEKPQETGGGSTSAM